MGTATLGTLVVQLATDTVKFEGDLGRAALAAEASMNRIKDTTQKALGAVVTIAAAAGAALLEMVNGAVERAADLEKFSKMVGLSTDQLSRLQVAAKLTGVSNESLDTSLKRLSATVGLALGGNDQAQKKFDALGISMDFLKSHSNDLYGIFLKVSDVFAHFEESPVKVADAIEIMGRSGNEVLPMLDLSAKGLKAMADAADALHVTLDPKAAEAAHAFKQKLEELELVRQGFTNQLMQAMLPALDNLVSRLVSASQNTTAMNAALTISVDFFKSLLTVVGVLIGSFKTLTDAMSTNLAAVILAMSGNFKGAFDTIIKGGAEVVHDVTNTVGIVSDLWKNAKFEPPKQANGMTDVVSSLGATLDSIQEEIDKHKMQAPVMDLGPWKETVENQFNEIAEKISATTETELSKESAHIEALTLTFGKKTEAMHQGFVHLWDMFDQMGQRAAQGIGADFENFFFDPVKTGFKGLLSSFVDTLRHMIAQAASAKLMQSLFGFDSQGNSLLGGFFSSMLGSTFGLTSGAGAGGSGVGAFSGAVGVPGLARGGPAFGGSSYMVGENGPELFTPNSNGVVSNGGGGQVVINNHIDARGATVDLAAALPSILKQNNDTLEGKIVDGIRRRKYGL